MGDDEAVEKADEYADDLQDKADKELEDEFEELEKALDDSQKINETETTNEPE